MKGYLLDTNHLSPLVTLKHPLRQKIIDKLQAGHEIGIPVPVLAEMLYGIGILPRSIQNMAEWERLKSNFRFYLPEVSDAEKSAELRIALRRKGWQLETVDAFIAIIAVRYGLTLLTTDKDFSAVPELQTENWLVD